MSKERGYVFIVHTLVFQLSGNRHKALNVFKEAFATLPVKLRKFITGEGGRGGGCSLKIAECDVEFQPMYINIRWLAYASMNNCAQAESK